MPVLLTWQQIALRIVLALAASFLIGLDRDEHGKTSGIRTTMLVCLAATLAMLQANQLMASTGKTQDSFVVLDLMRMPLGILTGIGFIGAGAIIRKDGLVHGLTTAATLWYVTILGLLFGGGQLLLAISATIIALFILWFLKHAEKLLSTQRSGTLYLELAEEATTESELRDLFHNARFEITQWNPLYQSSTLHSLTCELRWTCKASDQPQTPSAIQHLQQTLPLATLSWKS